MFCLEVERPEEEEEEELGRKEREGGMGDIESESSEFVSDDDGRIGAALDELLTRRGDTIVGREDGVIDESCDELEEEKASGWIDVDV